MQRIHTGEKPFKCIFCDRAFSQPSHLKAHTRAHTDQEKPKKGTMAKKCSQCNFTSMLGLSQHMIIHNGKKPNKCGRCDYASNRADHLKNHLRKHTGEKPYKCKECIFACSRANHLKTHMMTHTGEKPFKCILCDHASSQTSHLKAHMRTHDYTHCAKMLCL